MKKMNPESAMTTNNDMIGAPKVFPYVLLGQINDTPKTTSQ